ncbi:hypothetical protein [Sphingomonas sp.]|uniref:hypothetical protein n=1 Tax=Sphingomonas sp. TaxID=28214 RepID=UPI0035C7E5F9
MTRDLRIARWWAAGAAWFFGLALSGALDVPFWRDAPRGDGFDLSLTAAVTVWLLVGALQRPARVIRVDVSRDGIVVHEAER